MSKKVDIEKLIESKYSDDNSSTSLTLESLISEIDLVLERIAGTGAEQVYGSKLPGDLGESDYINVATDNPGLSMGHGVERGNADGASDGGNIGKPIIDNPLPEAKDSPQIKWQKEKEATPKSGMRELSLKILTPVLTHDALTIRQDMSDRQVKLDSDFFRACQIAGVHSKVTMKEKLETLKTAMSPAKGGSLVQMLSSMFLVRSIYNSFISLKDDSFGHLNEDIVAALYGAAAKSTGRGSGTGAVGDIQIGERSIGLKTKLASQKFETSVGNIFTHVVLLKKPYEIFWFAKVTNEPDYFSFYFDARLVDIGNMHKLFSNLATLETGLLNFINYIDSNRGEPQVSAIINKANTGKNVEAELAMLMAQLIQKEPNKYGSLDAILEKKKAGDIAAPPEKSANQPPQKPESIPLTAKITGKITAFTSSQMKLEQLFRSLPPSIEQSYEFSIDVNEYISGCNEFYKFIDSKIVELHNSLSEFVTAYNNFIIPDVPGAKTVKNLNFTDGKLAIDKAREIPKKTAELVEAAAKNNN